MTEKAALPRRFLRPLLLLSLADEEVSYGYQLAEAVRGHGLQVDLAGVYRDMRSMEQRNLVTSTWEPSASGPHRRVYQLTPKGRVAAADARLEIAAIIRMLTAALGAEEAR